MDGNGAIFDESWDLKANVSENENFWASSQATESILLLKYIVANNYKVKFAKNQNGLLVARLPEFNMEINLLAHSGLSSRRGEPYVVGDILLFITIRREDYTYSSVTKRGFKYINILERDRLKSLLEEPKVAPELLDSKLQYGPIDSGTAVLIPGKSSEEPSNITSSKLSVEKIFENIYYDLKSLYDKYKQTQSTDELSTSEGKSDDDNTRLAKKAKHDYLNSLVFTTTIKERPVRTRNSLITVHGEGFERILQKAEYATVSQKHTKHENPSASGAPKSQKKLRVIDEICFKYRKKPIIIVPSGTASIIARQNIKQLLQDNQFIDSQESLRAGGPTVSNLPMNAIEIVHTIAKRPVKFRVVENSYVSRFTNADWVSVVCVVLNVKGERWQFHGYPFESFIDLFMTMKGVLFVHDADMVPSEMGSWDIKVLRISRSHRHNDASIAKEFWQYMENFLLQPRQRKINHSKKLT
ncbi:RNA pol II accessory factor, Cdc73 family domain-containing protein [Theileria equi strain WA]|uniref:RNA pol II accessory factor, Cdc73 family domain-containing protein n=1 Tax=Theileria equi strain WA TaxID=1537102 RepID=L0B0W3_THEEQ|nr:RNA pol II accessory factor, Cdc73 family domain-containing protein [Theileria equi strain WA]AFZ81158.1 RNA pol II accessory factor, Cdc73 family domain-containing protein [Theileria equi strain WA]|eukprot:XP_004830824.1 RNA pol II accessory factor, Cdc73 family domain-containing protein [Theileria equi strain WA]